MHVSDMQKVASFSSHSSQKLTVWLSSCGREKGCEIWCALHNPLIYIASRNAPLLRVTLYCSAGCTRHYVIRATRSSLNDIGAAFTADHTSTDTWPLTQTNLDHCTSGTDGMQSLAARNFIACVCVCLFASLSERRRWAVRSQLCWSTSSAYSSCLRSPWDKWEKSDCPSQINTAKQTCTHNVHTCLPQRVDCAEKAVE